MATIWTGHGKLLMEPRPMRPDRFVVTLLCSVLFGVPATVGCVAQAPDGVLDTRFEEIIELPPPQRSGGTSLEEALTERRSGREFAPGPLPIETIGQLLWAGQGVTDDRGYRTAPSAGARYPLELYAVTATDVAHYLPDGHRVERRPDTTTLRELGDAAFDQQYVASAPLVVVVVGVPARTAAEYGNLAADFVEREVGHATQNVLLQATVLDLAAVPVGGFDPDRVARLLALGPGHEVHYLVPVGRPV